MEAEELREKMVKSGIIPKTWSGKKLYLDIDNLLEEYSVKHNHIYETTEEKKEEFLDKFAAEWRALAAKNLYEAEE